jgi:hypothetical protein
MVFNLLICFKHVLNILSIKYYRIQNNFSDGVILVVNDNFISTARCFSSEIFQQLFFLSSGEQKVLPWSVKQHSREHYQVKENGCQSLWQTLLSSLRDCLPHCSPSGHDEPSDSQCNISCLKARLLSAQYGCKVYFPLRKQQKAAWGAKVWDCQSPQLSAICLVPAVCWHCTGHKGT